MTGFRRSEDGFVLLFMLLMLPIFVGFGLIVVDMGRANTAHGDLSAAADAVALAGARELDGGVDAIERAKAAMGQVTNSVSMLGTDGPDREISLVFEDVTGNEFQIQFLRAIPERDTTPLTTAWFTANQALTGHEAEYVYVRAQSRDLETAFLNPINLLRENLPITATAVAMSTAAACDIPPIYICNPFEFDDSGGYVGDQLQAEFNAGNLHGRLIRLHPKGSGTHAPGNFGFLQVDGNAGAKPINDLFAGETNTTCYDANTVETKPGAANSISQGINTRFDMYDGPYRPDDGSGVGFPIVPAENVRKGAVPDVRVTGAGVSIEDCAVPRGSGTGAPVAKFVDDHIYDLATGVFNNDGVIEGAYGLPDNNTMLSVNEGVPGAAIGTDHRWPIGTYFSRNYGSGTGAPNEAAVISSFSGLTPSRYDVYLAEIANGWTGIRGPGEGTSGGNDGELGLPNCAATESPAVYPDLTIPDRRIIVGAIIDCGTGGTGGGTNTYPVNSYASMFMTRPMVTYNPSVDQTIDVEIVDITGYGGNGTLEEFIRQESILVR